MHTEIKKPKKRSGLLITLLFSLALTAGISCEPVEISSPANNSKEEDQNNEDSKKEDSSVLQEDD